MKTVYLVINPDGVIERIETNKDKAYDKSTYEVLEYLFDYFILEVSTGNYIYDLLDV